MIEYEMSGHVMTLSAETSKACGGYTDFRTIEEASVMAEVVRDAQILADSLNRSVHVRGTLANGSEFPIDFVSPDVLTAD